MNIPTPSSEAQLKDLVAKQLSKTGASVTREVYVHGIQADFLVIPAYGRRIVFEIKNWDPTPANLERAAEQARLMKRVTQAEELYLVLPELPTATEIPGVIAESDITKVLGKVEPLHTPDDPAAFAFAAQDPVHPPERILFAAMPFSAEYDDVFFVAMASAAEQVEAVVKRTDKEAFEGDIVAKVQALLQQSVAVIADLSESRPNVMYEVGYAHALNRPTVPICSTSLDAVPFDVRNWNVLPYLKGRTFELREQLAKRLRAAIKP